MRFKEGQRTRADIYNDTDTPEQLHWRGQQVGVDVDGAAKEGTPYIPAHGMRRISFVPGPAGFRFYHTHVVPRADLSRDQYSGLVGPVYIEPKQNPGAYDQEIFLTLKEFESTFSRGGDMATDFLAGGQDPDLKDKGEAAMNASLAHGDPRGYEVGYGGFAINGHMLGHGDPIRVQTGQRVLLHVLNGSATETRSLALPGHKQRFQDSSYPEAATVVSGNDIFASGRHSGRDQPLPVESWAMPSKSRYLAAPMSAAAAALAIAAAPTAAAQLSETCTNVNTGSTICESPGNAEVNDSLSRANTSPQWAADGGQSGGPYGGTLGGGSR